MNSVQQLSAKPHALPSHQDINLVKTTQLWSGGRSKDLRMSGGEAIQVRTQSGYRGVKIKLGKQDVDIRERRSKIPQAVDVMNSELLNRRSTKARRVNIFTQYRKKEVSFMTISWSMKIEPRE